MLSDSIGLTTTIINGPKGHHRCQNGFLEQWPLTFCAYQLRKDNEKAIKPKFGPPWFDSSQNCPAVHNEKMTFYWPP
jgi:hypothetical protein